MADVIRIEIIAFPGTSCSPFPCDDTRTCGLTECSPFGTVEKSFEVVKKTLTEEFGSRVDVSLLVIDKEVPDRIKAIVESEHPPIPIILVNGRLTRIGRIDIERIKNEIRKEL